MRRGAFLALLLVWGATALPAQHPDSVTVDTVTPGVIHRHLVFNGGPWSVNVLAIDLRRQDLALEVVRADDRFHGREKVSTMASRHSSDTARVVAAINADFFNLLTGENENNQVIDGEIWKASRGVRREPRSQLGMTTAGRPVLERFSFDAVVLPRRGAPVALAAINDWPDSNALVLYTWRFGADTPLDSLGRHPAVLPLEERGRRGDTLLFRVAGTPTRSPVALVHGGALAAGGLSQPVLAALGKPGTEVRIVARFTPDPGALAWLVGGWPRLIVHGRSVADSSDALERTTSSFSVTRHPRTGVGLSRDSTTLYLVTVDGRQESSSGVSLVEFATLLLDLGCYEAINLDGGGSTAFVVNGKVINRPSDPGGERTVGNALLVVRHPPHR